MSEFKFACPVCGQHMMCDTTQAGTVMDCPTCFQKITAPNAPGAEEQKFILTGSKVVEKKPAASHLQPDSIKPESDNKFLMAAAFVVVLVLVAGGAMLLFKKQIVQDHHAKNLKSGTNEVAKASAPHANDANWMLTLGTNAIAETTVAGRIHGQDFISERATFSGGNLALREGTRGAPEFGVTINFSGAQPETLSGQTINVGTNADKAAKLTVRWKENGEVQKQIYESGYALRLEFGVLDKNRLPGKIYLCLPDTEKSYLLGSFTADARKPKPKAPKK